MARIVIVSFRLGGYDGVSIEAAKWKGALESLGHDVTTLAGQGDADVVMEGLAMHATRAPAHDELSRALEGTDVVVVENLVSLPLNVGARDVLCNVLEGRRAIFRHHDLAWQRAATSHLEPPRNAALWRHVTINELSTRELAERGVDATTIMNSFDCDPPEGDRSATRDALGLHNERLILAPTRAIPRKNIAGAITLAERLHAVLWMLGPPEDGYDHEFARLVNAANVDVRCGPLAGRSVDDAYAACDLVVVASHWEGFGNPVLESVTHRRALALHPYPVAREIINYGFRFFDLADVAGIEKILERPDEAVIDANLAIARQHFNITSLAARLRALLATINVH